jgi:nucleotide-binding universal stress UspA family protein
MGWGQRTGFRARLFGNVIDSVLWASHCPVAITRLLEDPRKIQRILVPIENLTSQAVQPVRFAQILADANQARVTLLHVCDRRTSAAKIAWNRSQLQLLVAKLVPDSNVEIEITPHDNVVKAIAQAVQPSDLVILRSKRQRTAGGLAISDVTSQLVQQLTCSVVMLGEPQRSLVGVSVTESQPKAVRTIS